MAISFFIFSARSSRSRCASIAAASSDQALAVALEQLGQHLVGGWNVGQRSFVEMAVLHAQQEELISLQREAREQRCFVICTRRNVTPAASGGTERLSGEEVRGLSSLALSASNAPSQTLTASEEEMPVELFLEAASVAGMRDCVQKHLLPSAIPYSPAMSPWEVSV